LNELHDPSGIFDTSDYKHSELTGQVIQIFYGVYNDLGYGFLERVYENGLLLRLRKAGFDVVQQYPIRVYLDGEVIGEYFADLVINDLVIVELKAIDKLNEAHNAQLINSLKATEYEVGLLLNFGPKPQVVRKIYDNRRKRLIKIKTAQISVQFLTS